MSEIPEEKTALQREPEVPEGVELRPSSIDNSVQLYLHAIGRFPLLTAEQEIELARIIQGDDREAAKRASRKLINSNLRLVVSIAKRYASADVSLLDLIQEGNTGLMRAAEKFHYQLGCRFSTYASWWIKQMIKKGLAERKRPIRLPAHVADQISKLNRFMDQFIQEHGREPTDAEYAYHLDFDPTEVQLWREADGETVSLEAPIGKDNDGTLAEIISDLENNNPDAEVQQKFLRSDLAKILDSLEESEAQLLKMRFGFNQQEHFASIDEVSKHFGITRDRARRMEFRALRRMKGMLGNSFGDYL